MDDEGDNALVHIIFSLNDVMYLVDDVTKLCDEILEQGQRHLTNNGGVL